MGPQTGPRHYGWQLEMTAPAVVMELLCTVVMEKIGQRLHQVILSTVTIPGNGVAYGTSNGTSPLWVAVGRENTYVDSGGYGTIMYSSNGKNWTKTTEGDSFINGGRGIAYGTSNGTSPLWVAVGDDAGDGYGSIMYSSNGKIWTKTT